MVNLETAVTDGACPEPQNKPYIFDAPASAVTALKGATVSRRHRGQRPRHGLWRAGPVAEPDDRLAGEVPDHRHRQHRRPGLRALPGDDQRPAGRDHHGDAGDRRQPRQHVDRVGDPTGCGIGDRPDPTGPRGPAGAPLGGHRDRLRPLGHRDAGLPEPPAGAAGAAARQGGSRHRHRVRHPRPPGRRLSRRRLRRLRARQPRLLRQHGPRDRQRDARRHRAGSPHHRRRLAARPPSSTACPNR